MRSRTFSPVLLSVVLLTAMLAGCLGSDGDDENDSPIDLIVYYDVTAGIIEETIQNNQQVSEDGVDVVFDYSYTKSTAGEITNFLFSPGDGSTTISVNSADTGEITYTYLTHG
ncbi:MAG: hypothetical protein P8Q98_02045, partial [Candidatus Poseidoniaceae archaeon]|nr:hypothetical protein [Candidatus Poseidoniaceae archaeon]